MRCIGSEHSSAVIMWVSKDRGLKLWTHPLMRKLLLISVEASPSLILGTE